MHTQIHLPTEKLARSLVRDLVQGIFDSIGHESVVGIYLGGSLALGGFNPESSDLDFLVIVKDPIKPGAMNALDKMHHSLRMSNINRLYTNFEGEYLAYEQARRPFSIKTAIPHLGSDGHFGFENKGPAFIIDVWKIRKSGFVVYGPVPKNAIGYISVDDMLVANKEIFKSWWLPKLERRENFDSEYQAYAVLTMARILYAIRQKNEVSKKEAAEWLMAEEPRFSGLLGQALRWKDGVVLNRQQEIFDLIAFVNAQIL